MRFESFSRTKLALFIVLTLSLTLLSASTLPNNFSQLNPEQLWFTHLSLELVSIFVSVSIVTILFHRTVGVKSRLTNTLICCFTVIALLDYLHSLSFHGMPIFFTESSMEKAIFYWLPSRAIELTAMLGIALHVKLPGPKVLWLVIGIIVAAVIGYLGVYHLERFPMTFHPTTGVTAFKVNMEYAFFIGYAILTFIFMRQFQVNNQSQQLYIAGSCYAMALCALTLTSIVTPSDFSLLVGHLFKILSAIFIYNAIYKSELKRPYKLAKQADAKMHKKDSELRVIMSNIPIGIMRFDASFNLIFINDYMQIMSKAFANANVGSNIKDSLPKTLLELLLPRLQQAILGNKVEFRYQYTYTSGKIVHREIILVPEKEATGSTETVICLVVDTTQAEMAERKKIAALRETEKLRKALDEHAIVAFTDVKGVITSVNNKFCQISQYTKEELVGKTHQIINSKYHPPSFFQNMWKTIAKGKIWHGEVCNKAKDGSLYWVNTTIVPFSNNDGKIAEYIAIRADITERKLAEQEAKRLAYYDDLTSLPNRRLLKEEIIKTLKNQEPNALNIHALLLLDLDNFKDINDSLDHAAGDELLKQVAFRLQKQTGTNQIAARLGGDEFVLFMAGVGKTKQVASIKVAEQAEKIRATLAQPYTLNNQSITVTASIGAALFDSSAQDEINSIKQADIAMYQSKALGRNQVSFFDPELQIALNNRNEMLRELNLAIAQNELKLFYQPIFDQHKTIIGCEALIRWQSSTLGMVSPAQFIPLAEQSNLILDIGAWVLQTACHQLHLWSLNDLSSAWTLAVNVSAKQLQQENFVASVQMALQQHRANPNRLKLEITESMLQVNVDETIKSMQQLRAMGIRFSLDDFGTGYSSLSYLTKLPIDTLKIDRSFVDNMIISQENTAVVTMILSLATALELDVVAEGVETDAQLAFLIEAGCQNFQGYLLGKPVPAEQVTNQPN